MVSLLYILALFALVQSNKNPSTLHYGFNHKSGILVEEKRSSQFDTVQYVFTNALYKPNSNPLWRNNGIDQQCLLFDGYSTYIEKKDFVPSKEFTISVWVAPRAFEWGDEGKLSIIVNQQDLPNKRGFALGVFRHGAWSFQFGDGKDWIELWDKGHALPKNEWSFVTATLKGNHAALYLNGKLVNQKHFKSPFVVAQADQKLIIGQHNQAVKLGGNPPFKLNMFNGLMDELWIQEHAMKGEEVKALFDSYTPSGVIPKISLKDIALDFTIFEGDRYRPVYHAIAPAHWMNEPHAPFFYKGKYHLFYQHNPTGPYWHQIHWGHWVSEDKINWKHAPIALSPEKGDLTPDGIWSGGANYDAKGNPVLFFTAGNDSKKPNQAVAISRPKDINDPNLKEWVNHPDLVTEQPNGFLFNEFRDPFVWKEKDQWYMLVGTGIENKGGTAALFTSKDIVNWEYKNPFYISDFSKYPELGLVWELPVFLPVGKYASGETKYIMLICPVRDPAVVEVYYWLGRFDKEKYKFIPDQVAPQLIDYGRFGFTGPSGMIDPKTGKPVIFSIAQGKYRGLSGYEMGWAHNAGLPISLNLDNKGELLVEPVEEIKNNRGEKLISIQNKSLKDANKALENITGDQLEIKVSLISKTRQPYGLIVRKSKNGEEQTKLFYNPDKETFGIDRSKTTKYQKNEIDEGPLSLDKASFDLRVFLDKSMLEAYANKRKSITSRTYCSLEDALGIEIFGDKNIKIKSLEIWKVRPIDWDYVD
jgi:beta-fructofuranosidase